MSSASPGTFCDHCHLPRTKGTKCCLALYTEIEKYKRHVFHSYILEALFDVTVSVISVILDITTLVVYATKRKWTLVCITAFPVLLPTTIFTNVYMSDESRGYCKMPKNKRRNQKLKKNESSYSVLNRMEDRIQGGRKLGIFNLLACCSGLLHSIFHRDRRIRQRGMKLARKSVRRSLKYVFGTLVLRFIAWAWYIKALLFGYRAMREPKKYMKMEQPDTHWSRELLIRLDFLQAAMENAPQCIIQLYTLLTDNSEDQVLGVLTLAFSFIDFLRVVTSVFWNVEKGPVRAPKDCYGGSAWQAVNWASWFLLYVARCCAIALVIGSAATSGFGAVFIVPIGTLIGHCLVFGRILSYKRFGREIMDKLAVTTFISIFFLPEFDTKNMKIVVQVYSAMILLENTLFIVPYRGLSFSGYCLTTSWINKNATKPVPKGLLEDMNDYGGPWSKAFSSDHQDCLIDPVVIVLMVPTFTILGQVLRMGAQYKMLKFQESGLDEPRAPTYNVEERVATIYNKRWTNMSVKEMWNNFVNMVTHKNMGPVDEVEENLSPEDLKSTFGSSQEFIRKSCFTICANDESKLDKGPGKTSIYSGHWGENSVRYPLSSLMSSKEGESRENSLKRQNTLPRLSSSNSQTYSSSFIFDDPERNFLQTLDVRFLRVDTPKGVQIFETCNI